MSRPSARSTSRGQVGERPADVRAQPPQLAGQRVQPRVARPASRRRVTQVVERLDQAAGLRGQVGDRLGQRVRGVLVPGCDRRGAGGSAARRLAGRPLAAGQGAGAAAERHQVARPDPPARPGQQPGQRVRRRPRRAAPAAWPPRPAPRAPTAARRAPPPRPGCRGPRAPRRSGDELGPLPAQHRDVRRPHPPRGRPVRATAGRPARTRRSASSAATWAATHPASSGTVSSSAHATVPRPARSGADTSRGTSGASSRSSSWIAAAASSTRPELRKLVDNCSTGPGRRRRGPERPTRATTGKSAVNRRRLPALAPRQP